MSDTKVYLIIGIVCVIISITYYWFLCGKDLYDNGVRTHTTYQQLERVGEHQQSTYDNVKNVRGGLDRSIETIGRIEERNKGIEESVDKITGRNETSINIIGKSTERINESKAILDRVRERETKN